MQRGFRKEERGFKNGKVVRSTERNNEMLKKQGAGLIAVIEENTGTCVEEITYEEIFD